MIELLSLLNILFIYTFKNSINLIQSRYKLCHCMVSPFIWLSRDISKMHMSQNPILRDMAAKKQMSIHRCMSTDACKSRKVDSEDTECTISNFMNECTIIEVNSRKH